MVGEIWTTVAEAERTKCWNQRQSNGDNTENGENSANTSMKYRIGLFGIRVKPLNTFMSRATSLLTAVKPAEKSKRPSAESGSRRRNAWSDKSRRTLTFVKSSVFYARQSCGVRKSLSFTIKSIMTASGIVAMSISNGASAKQTAHFWPSAISKRISRNCWSVKPFGRKRTFFARIFGFTGSGQQHIIVDIFSGAQATLVHRLWYNSLCIFSRFCIGKTVDTRAKRDRWVQSCIWLSRFFFLFGFWSQAGRSEFAPTPYTFWHISRCARRFIWFLPHQRICSIFRIQC